MDRRDALRLLTMTRDQAAAIGQAQEWERVKAAHRRSTAERHRWLDDVLAELDPGACH